jgi:hypothetical protein
MGSNVKIPLPWPNHISGHIQGSRRGAGPYDFGIMPSCRVVHDLKKPKEVMHDDSDVPGERLLIGKTDTQIVLELYPLPYPFGYLV